MELVLKGRTWKTSLDYMDGVMVMREFLKNHFNKLGDVLSRLKKEVFIIP